MFSISDARLTTAALASLDGANHDFAQAAGSDGYAVWVGSAISRDRVPSLPVVIGDLLEKLRNLARTDTAHRTAFDAALGLAALSASERRGVHITKKFDSWAIRDAVLARLSLRYSELLDIPVAGEKEDYLLWDLVDVRRTYGAGDPDAEHICLALLAAEGALASIVSANWDGFIEGAFARSLGDDEIRVVVSGKELRGSGPATTLLKFHGCAVLAGSDPSTFRPLVVGRKSQISAWPSDATFSRTRDELVRLARDRRSLVIGLSAQDEDIRHVFAKADAASPWHWDDSPPPHVVVGPTLDASQSQLLHLAYRSDFSAHQGAIETRAHLALPAKHFLLALFLHCVFEKRIELLKRSGVDPALLPDLIEALRRYRDAMLSGRRGNWTTVVVAISDALTSRQRAFESEKDDGRYRPTTATRLDRIARSRSERALPLLSLAESLIWHGARRAWWRTRVEVKGAGGVTVLHAHGRTTFIAVAVGEVGAIEIERNWTRPDVLTVVVAEPETKLTRRSPSATYGRTGRSTRRRVSLADLNVAKADLADRFRSAVAP